MEPAQETVRLFISLAPGYLAYCVYKLDADWRDLRQMDVIYGSLIFSVLSYGCAEGIEYALGRQDSWLFALLTFGTAFLIAFAYRSLIEPWTYSILRRLGATNQDSRGNVWQKLFNDPQIYVTQIHAYLKSGEAIGCDDTSYFDRPDLRKRGIFPYYSHLDGQLCFVPTRRKHSDGEWEDVIDVEAGAEWGLRMIYVNPRELERLELRLTAIDAIVANPESRVRRCGRLFIGWLCSAGSLWRGRRDS